MIEKESRGKTPEKSWLAGCLLAWLLAWLFASPWRRRGEGRTLLSPSLKESARKEKEE